MQGKTTTFRQRTRLEELQWEHMKLGRAKADIGAVRAGLKDRGLLQSPEYSRASQTIILVEELMWEIEREIRVEQRLQRNAS